MSTWILLRGLTREEGHWGDFPRHMAEALPEAKVRCLELPGNGAFNGLQSPTHIDGMVAHCHGESLRLGLEPPFSLLAMSMGAMVAVAWAEAHPADIEACVLINTSFGGFNPLDQRLRPRAWPRLLRTLLAGSDEGRERLVFQITSRLAPEDATVADWVAIRRARPVSLKNALRQLLAAARFRAPVMAPVPTLILAGATDGLVDPRCSGEIARRWACDLAVHPEAGHDLPLDDGSWVAQQVRHWEARKRREAPDSGKMDEGAPP